MVFSPYLDTSIYLLVEDLEMANYASPACLVERACACNLVLVSGTRKLCLPRALWEIFSFLMKRYKVIKGETAFLLLGGFVCGYDTQNCSSNLEIMRVEDKRKGAECGRVENWEKYVTLILFLHSSLTNFATTPPLILPCVLINIVRASFRWIFSYLRLKLFSDTCSNWLQLMESLSRILALWHTTSLY